MPNDNIADLKVIDDLGEWKAAVEERFTTEAQRLSEAGYPEQETQEFIEKWSGLGDHFTGDPTLKLEINTHLLDFTQGQRDHLTEEVCRDYNLANSAKQLAGEELVELPEYCGPSGPKM